jgi:hypothetical protein
MTCLADYVKIRDRLTAAPEKWLTVKELAELYGLYYSESRARRAAISILSPLGLDTQGFIANQKMMIPSLVSKISTELINFEIEPISTIFAGVDPLGPTYTLWKART